MANYISLGYRQAHQWVAEQQAKGRKVFWDGWDIMSFRPNPAGFLRKDGAFIDGQWGTLWRIKVNKYGRWRVIDSSRAVGARS
jgi:hypothetical protein